jgi:hypothetical protein
MKLSLFAQNQYAKFITYRYHTPVPILRLRKYGIARPSIYFDVTSLALYKHSVKTRKMLALYYRHVNEIKL